MRFNQVASASLAEFAWNKLSDRTRHGTNGDKIENAAVGAPSDQD